MSKTYCEQLRAPFPATPVLTGDQRARCSLAIELTARCNNDCRHCCVNLPAGDGEARARELAPDEIERIARDAVGMGAISCLIAGGEPLLREDFGEVYLRLKRLGLFVSVTTNACLVSPKHIELLRRYPPRTVDVRVFGTTPEVYERVTRRSGSFRDFEQGLSLLLESGLKVSLTAVATRRNVHELPALVHFCHARVGGKYVIESILPLRFDSDRHRNEEIVAERLSPAEMAAVERSEVQRFRAMPGRRRTAFRPDDQSPLHRTWGQDFAVTYDGRLRLRSAGPEAACDLRQCSLREAWRGSAGAAAFKSPGNEGVDSRTSQSQSAGAGELLLRCLSSAGPDSLELSVSDSAPQWTSVVELARDWGLAPLLHRRLAGCPARPTVPPEVLLELSLDYAVSRDRSELLFGSLRTALEQLLGEHIRVIVLKGAYLAEVVYGDIAVRPMQDVDIMVPKADVPRARAVLLDRGFALERPAHAASRLQRRRRLVLSLGASIDICGTIDVPAGRSRLDPSGFWDRARLATVAGVEVLTLSPEDLLLHLCLHASYRHGLESGLRPFCDIAEVIQRFPREMDWTQVVERARRWRTPRYVGLTLCLARNMLGAVVPDCAIEQLVPGGVEQHIQTAARVAVLARTGYLKRMSAFDRLGAETLGDKVRLTWERVFLSRDDMAEIYPAARESRHLWLYYWLRLRDVGRTLTSDILRRSMLTVRGRGQDPNAALLDWLRSKRP